MADAYKRSNRKPDSLNDSHYRLLQDLSAPPKKPPSYSANAVCEEDEGKPSMVKLEGRQRLCKASGGANARDDDDHNDDDDIPKFSQITDFGSPPDENKPAKVKIKGRRRLCKISYRDDVNRILL